MARIVPANKFIRKGVDEGEYADAGITESLRQLRRRVQGTAEKGLGAAGRTPRLRGSRPSRMAPVIGLESSGDGPRTQRGRSCERTAKSGGTTREGLSRSEEHTSELQSQSNLVCRLLLEKKKTS